MVVLRVESRNSHPRDRLSEAGVLEETRTVPVGGDDLVMKILTDRKRATEY